MEVTARQQNIIDSAIQIISREGYREFTTKHLADVVGISEAALYRHFVSKTQIVHSILDYFQETANTALGNIRSEIKDPLEQVKAYVMNRYNLFKGNPDLATLMFSEEIFYNDRTLAEHNLDIMHMHREQLVQSIVAAQKRDEIHNALDPVQVFRIIIGSMRLLVTQWQLSHYAFDLQSEGEKLWQTIADLISYKQIR